MYDGGKIIPGLVIFLALILYPFWSNIGGAAPVPKPTLPDKKVATKCVRPTAFMKTSHMTVLNDWRDLVVRQADRIFVNDQGQQFNMSLSNTCMQCHNDKAKFCDQCHNYLAVAPYCWDCHIEPKPKESK